MSPARVYHAGMSFTTLTLDGFLDQVASKTPAPGGGAVASAVGALSAALAGMVVAYSTGKKNLAAHEPLLQDAAKRLARAREIMMTLADEDAQAYSIVNELGKLPETDARRLAEHGPALLAAAQIPLAVVAASVELLRLFAELGDKTNRYLRSDLGIAAVLAEATARSSAWNVAINAAQLPEADRARVTRELGVMLEESKKLCARVEEICRV